MDDKIRILIEEELTRANKKFPPFTSSYDGFGILYEELDEAEDEWNQIKYQVKQLIFGIRQGSPAEIQSYTLSMIYHHCLTSISETIQVAAMALKFIQLLQSKEAAK